MPDRSKLDPVGGAVVSRHTFGSTERILRRNRKTWTRLGNKRRNDRDALVERTKEVHTTLLALMAAY